jgi:hypothetical protein
MAFPATFTIREASGRAVTSNVHGNGGPIAGSNARARMEQCIRFANAGRPLPIYEPKPGHVRAYQQTAAADLDETTIDLRGATLVSVDC